MTSNPSTQSTKLHILVIAHPDDESMFFIPTIRALLKSGETMWLLCLTTGDYDGLGKQRSKEIYQAAKLLGFEKCIVQNSDAIQDHPTQRWKTSDVVQAIQTAIAQEQDTIVRKYKSLVLLTFDDKGVSGHVNHIDTYLGVQQLISSQQKFPIHIVEAWQLESETNPIIKYIPVLSWIFLLLSLVLSSQFHIVESKHAGIRVYRCHEPSLNWKAMAAHHSQFVWYRRLFVVFSCYTYVNSLKQIEPLPSNKGKRLDR